MDTIGNGQRLAFTVGVSPHMHKMFLHFMGYTFMSAREMKWNQ